MVTIRAQTEKTRYGSCMNAYNIKFKRLPPTLFTTKKLFKFADIEITYDIKIACMLSKYSDAGKRSVAAFHTPQIR